VQAFAASTRVTGCCLPALGTRRPDIFSRFASHTARLSGHAVTFLIAVLLIVGWVAAGPFFQWGDSWQLTINTATTIVTFLMVFLIQNTQTRDIEAMHVKLDALVLNTKGAKNELMDLEELAEKDLRGIQEEYQQLGRKYQKHVRHAKGKPGKRGGRAKQGGRKA